jgi:hypothetical protein
MAPARARSSSATRSTPETCRPTASTACQLRARRAHTHDPGRRDRQAAPRAGQR